ITGPQAPGNGGMANAQELALVPWPAKVGMGKGSMALREGGRIVAQERSLLPLARILAEEIFLATGVRLTAGMGRSQEGEIGLEIAPSVRSYPPVEGQGANLSPYLKVEAYTLLVGRNAMVRGASY